MMGHDQSALVIQVCMLCAITKVQELPQEQPFRVLLLQRCNTVFLITTGT